jgi:hypothetical protein
MKIIKFDNLETDKVRWDIAANESIWFDDTHFEVWVTVTGLDYLNQYYLRQSNFTVNDKLGSNTEKQTIILNSQKKYLYLTAFFTACTLVISVLMFISDKSKDELQSQVQLQAQQVHNLQIKLSHATNLPFQKPEAKKTVPKNGG